MTLWRRFKGLKYIASVGVGVLSIYSYKIFVDNDDDSNKTLFSRVSVFATSKDVSVCSKTENTPVDLSQQTPPELQKMTLKSVQVFFRHGARTPLRHLVSQVAEVPYLSDVLLRELPYTAIPIVVRTPSGGPRPESNLQARYRKVHFQGGCHAGQLTVVGQDQTFCLGRRLRQEYIDKYGLVNFFNPQDVYLRSTNIDRTIQSLRCVVAGMFSELQPLQSAPIEVEVREPHHPETLVPNTRVCPCLDIMEKKVAEVGPQMTSVKMVTDKINSILGREGQLSMMNWRDHIAARKAHGLNVPEFMDRLHGEIDKAAVDIFEAYTTGLPEDRPNFLRLSAGHMLHTIHENMQRSITDTSSPKVYLYSVHDSSLVPLLHGLSAFDDRWPPYAADVRVELWEDKDKENWVHLTYCGKALIPKGHRRSVIRMAEFERLISPYAISIDTFWKECQDLHGIKANKKQDMSGVYQEEDDEKSMARKGL